jgi:dynein heavy chain
LDEDTLIDMLKNSKKVSAEIQERIASAAIVEVEIKKTREAYIPAAVRGSIVYFVVADLSMINAMY